MNKAEALRIAVNILETYEELMGHYEVTNSISLRYDYMPSVEDVSRFSNYILENDDRNLYNATFGRMDFSFIGRVLNLLHGEWFKINEEVRNQYIAQYYNKEKPTDEFAYIDNLATTYDFFEKISEERNLIKAVFKNIVPSFSEQEKPEEYPKTSNSKAGRKRGEFKDFIKPSYKDKADDIIRMLRSELDGLKGKAVAIVLIAAIKNGYIVKPEKASFDREFGNHIDKDSYSRYMREEQEPDLWRSDEVRHLQRKLKL